MHPAPVRHRVAIATATTSPIASLFVDEQTDDAPRIIIPRPDIHLVVRLGPSAGGGLDAHAMGVRQAAYRKRVRGGQRTVIARLRVGACEAVLGVPAAEITGRMVALDDLWGATAARQLLDRLEDACDSDAAAGILAHALAERAAMAKRPRVHLQQAFDAAENMADANVRNLARDLGMSERHLRRVFRDATGISPKTFARLRRFHRALDAARPMRESGDHGTTWTTIAAAAGYYDQAHLISDFRAIAGVTPSELLAELHQAV